MTYSPDPHPGTARPDWRTFARAHWAGDPAVTADAPGPGLGPADVHRLLTAAAARPGQARLTTSDALLPAPGPLLPGPRDPDTAAYVRRLAAAPELAGDGWLLTVGDPLVHDFGLWARVRDVLDGLWRQVGRPALPVTAELAVGDRHHMPWERPARADSAGLVWVLDGALTARVRPEHTGTEYVLDARAGDLVHRPAGCRLLAHRPGPCTTRTLTVPARHEAALPYVAETLSGLLRDTDGPAAAADGPAEAADGRLVVAAGARRDAERFRALLAGPAPERALRLRWAALRSAAGLYPAPPLRPGIPLPPELRLRRVTPVVRSADAPGGAVWAANGHAWPVPAPLCDLLPDPLDAARTGSTVADLAAAAGLRPDDPALLALLDALCRARALEPA
jgi:hypothetical protein